MWQGARRNDRNIGSVALVNWQLNEAFQFYVSYVRMLCFYEEVVVTLACCFVTIWVTYAIIDLGPWHVLKPNDVILACYGKVIIVIV